MGFETVYLPPLHSTRAFFLCLVTIFVVGDCWSADQSTIQQRISRQLGLGQEALTADNVQWILEGRMILAGIAPQQRFALGKAIERLLSKVRFDRYMQSHVFGILNQKNMTMYATLYLLAQRVGESEYYFDEYFFGSDCNSLLNRRP